MKSYTLEWMNRYINLKCVFALFSLATMLLFSAVAVAGDFAEKPKPKDFRGFAWGTPLDKVPGLLKVQKPGYKNTYFRKSEPLSMGDADIVSVAYTFRKDRLYRVGVAFRDEVNLFLLRQMLVGQFGPGRQVGASYGWMWEDFSVELRYDRKTRQGGLIYTYEGPLDTNGT